MKKQGILKPAGGFMTVSQVMDQSIGDINN
jgi:hypothetical protein